MDPSLFGMPSLEFLNYVIPSYEQFTHSSSVSNNSTSDDMEQLSATTIIDERRQRRMISNRESARRSRMRKQKHLDELWSQVVRLRTENNDIMDRLNHVCECHDKVVHENEKLKQEASDLRQMLKEIQIGGPFAAHCNKAHLRVESSSQSMKASIDLLH